MMQCSEAKPLLDPLLDGALEAKDCALVLSHLETCTECKREWEGLEELRNLIRAQKEKPLDTSAAMKRIAAAIEQEHASQNRQYRQNYLKIAPTMVAMFLLIGIIVLAGKQQFDAPPATALASAGTLVDSLAASVPIEPVSDRMQMGKKLGFDIKYLPLSAWRMERCGIFKAAGSGIARFDFVSKKDGVGKLSCYQGMQGSIAKVDGESKQIGEKQVVIGSRGQYQFAQWTQNGRDYLFVTPLSKDQLEEIVRGA